MAAGGGNGGGLFSVAWGLWATGFGWIIATDFRGAARRFHGMSQKFTLFDRASTSGNGVGFVRCVAGVFALAGPLILVFGIVELLKGHPGPTQLPQPPLAVTLTTPLFGAVGLWALYRRSGPLRHYWVDGTALQRAAATVITAAVIAFWATVLLGNVPAIVTSWLAGGLAGLTLLLTTPVPSTASQPSDSPDKS
ncbi:hypothetical protein OG612_42280 (plasmid) [Streptomyces sp. NBC_01527]|uniref:hypothetical protein n=1 Tax=unclassified Streptomyces TaxID=2593676 RepID=UPI002E1354CD|nr:hypothetical protein OG763_45925 [Streptomyces sp. NBC_01230]